MTGYWKLDDRELGDSATEIFITGSARGTGVNVDTQAIYGGSETFERTGKELTRLNLTFTILGQDTGKHDWIAYITGILENRKEIRLESPEEDDDYRPLDNFRSLLFTPEGKVQVTQVNRAQYDLTVAVVVHGAPFGAGGSATESMTGYFTFLDNDFFTGTADVTQVGVSMIGLPEQQPGFPKLTKNAAPFNRETVAGPYWVLVAMLPNGNTALAEIYDVSGYAFNLPWTEGQGGPVH